MDDTGGDGEEHVNGLANGNGVTEEHVVEGVEWEGSSITYNDPEEKRVLFAALDSFYQYAKTAHYNTTHIRRQNFYALPRAHWELLAAPPISYLDTLSLVDDAIDKNAEVAQQILTSGLESFGISSPPEAQSPNDWRGTATPGDLEKARSTIRQLYRDWSAEGAAERAVYYGRVIPILQGEQQSLREREQTGPLKVLVPGAGLGRLVFDLSTYGFDVEGNEISYHQLFASSYILNRCPQPRVHRLYPWVHGFSNHRNRSNHLKSVLVPDVSPRVETEVFEREGKLMGEMSMSASDFLCLYGDAAHKEAFDAVVSIFFLDTAPNIIRYLEVIRHCLRPGGLLINFGPLLWHFENVARGAQEPLTNGLTNGDHQPQTNGTTHDERGIMDPGSVELTGEEVVQLTEQLGFEIIKEEHDVEAPYIQDPESMMQNIYKASFWVARKKSS